MSLGLYFTNTHIESKKETNFLDSVPVNKILKLVIGQHLIDIDKRMASSGFDSRCHMHGGPKM